MAMYVYGSKVYTSMYKVYVYIACYKVYTQILYTHCRAVYADSHTHIAMYMPR